MHIVLVQIHIQPEFAGEFRQACLENAKNSLLEPGVTRFDVLEQKDDPSRYILFEVYHTPEDQLRHRETRHYLARKDRVTEMMAEPRVGLVYTLLYPPESEWK